MTVTPGVVTWWLGLAAAPSSAWEGSRVLSELSRSPEANTPAAGQVGFQPHLASHSPWLCENIDLSKAQFPCLMRGSRETHLGWLVPRGTVTSLLCPQAQFGVLGEIHANQTCGGPGPSSVWTQPSLRVCEVAGQLEQDLGAACCVSVGHRNTMFTGAASSRCSTAGQHEHVRGLALHRG